jgi:butyryl-CoA dehydrogenase
MDYFLTDEQVQLKEKFRSFAEEKVKPVRKELDKESRFPREILEEMGKQGFFRLFVPEELGGDGLKNMNMCLAVEELAQVDAGVAVSFAVVGLGAIPIILAGTPEQRQRYMPKIAKGEWYTAFALTEPEAGSDAGNISTTARDEGDHYVLNGKKKFITNGGEAHINIVIASTEPEKGIRGLTAFIVERDWPGFGTDKTEDKMGIRGSVQRELVFEDVKVPKENVLGELGKGFKVAMMTLDNSRSVIGAQAVGIAQGAFSEAVRYSKERVQFGQPVSNFQAIQFMMADLATQIEAARALVYSVARYIDSGAKHVGKEAAMAKCFASDMAMRVTTDALQIVGGYGYMRDFPMEKYMRDAKITQIYEGTNQIQRVVIARSLMREFS